MAIITVLLLLASSPESGASTHARATAHILAAEEIDFARPDARPEGMAPLFRIVRRRSPEETVSPGAEGAMQLVEFQ